MRQKLTTISAKWSWPLMLVVIIVGSISVVSTKQVDSQVRDRQAAQADKQKEGDLVASSKPSQASASAVTSSFSSSNRETSNLKEGEPAADLERPINNKPRPVKIKKPARKPSKQEYRPELDDGEDDYEECYNDEDRYENRSRPTIFDSMTRNPMRQFSRMMNSAFDRMQGAFDDYNADYDRKGGSRASATSISGGNGYSKAVSSITTNGRTQGLVSETRNGRVSTRRIGDEDNDDDDDDQGTSYDA